MEDWRLFLKDFDDLALVRVIHDLRGHPEDKDYLYEALRELGQRRATSRARGTKRNPSRKRQHERKGTRS